jgi:hypothetical protein
MPLGELLSILFRHRVIRVKSFFLSYRRLLNVLKQPVPRGLHELKPKGV